MRPSPLEGMTLLDAVSPNGLPTSSARLRPGITLNNAAHPVLMRLIESVDPKQLGTYISALAEAGARALYFPAGGNLEATQLVNQETPAATELKPAKQPGTTAKPRSQPKTLVPPEVMDDLPDDLVRGFIQLKTDGRGT